MDKEKLVIGKTYLHHRKVDIGDRNWKESAGSSA